MGLRRTPIRLATATLLVIVSAALAACSGPARAPSAAQARHPADTISAGGNCSPSLPVHPLPPWARDGFTPPDAPMPQVLGARGDIIAILWAPKNPLWAPPLSNRNNKILWVSRVTAKTGAPMQIIATLAGSQRTATVALPTGPGPSIVNMPAPGCWTMHVTWAGNSDLLRLWYAAAPAQ